MNRGTEKSDTYQCQLNILQEGVPSFKIIVEALCLST